MSDKYEEYHCNQRDKIPWFPTVYYSKCVSCGNCVEYCKLGVYDIVEKNGKKNPVVKNPNNCVVFCTGCKDECPVDAISFPSKQKTRELIKKLEKNEKYV